MSTGHKTVWATLLLGIAMNVFAVPDATHKTSQVEGTQGYRDEINRPPEPYEGPPRTGKQVYDYRCGSCHARTTQGAPMPGDDIEWGMRARQGMDVLMEHVSNGYRKGLMPARGGCRNCSDAELKAAVVYMLQQSQVEIPQ